MSDTYLSFVIQNQYFAIDAKLVLEVIQNQDITSVPNAPVYIKGIINHRGEIIAIFETRNKFNLPERESGNTYVIMIIDIKYKDENYRVGAVVDYVKDVITIGKDNIKSVPSMKGELKIEYLKGLFINNDNYILIINPENIFTEIDFTEFVNYNC